YPGQLSGGQQQRVGVARALAPEPNILLMDEPFGAVDPIVRRELQDELLRLQAELGKTILFVTHDIEEAFRLGDEVVILQPGGVIAQHDTPAEILSNPADDFVRGFVGSDRAERQLRTETRNGRTIALDADGKPVRVFSKLRGCSLFAQRRSSFCGHTWIFPSPPLCLARSLLSPWDVLRLKSRAWADPS